MRHRKLLARDRNSRCRRLATRSGDRALAADALHNAIGTLHYGISLDLQAQRGGTGRKQLSCDR
jgi:hypothetical protein